MTSTLKIIMNITVSVVVLLFIFVEINGNVLPDYTVKRSMESHWSEQEENDDSRQNYMDKRRFGVLKFGKRPFGAVKFGKRNSINDNYLENSASDLDKRPFPTKVLFGKRTSEYQPDDGFNGRYINSDLETPQGMKNKRYSDILDNLYLQSILHNLQGRSQSWDGKRGKLLFGKRSSDGGDIADDGQESVDDESLIHGGLLYNKRVPKFGKRDVEGLQNDLEEMAL